MTQPITLWGLPHSLYTGRARSYLRTQGIAFVERPPTDPDFAARIMPAIGRAIIPVVELADGTIIQDTVDIIDHFEGEDSAPVPHPAYPGDARLLALAHLVELYAVVALTRHAMHYRWSYLAEQELFLRDAFATGGDEERAEATMARMHSYLPMLGVDAATIPAIEESYGELLATLDAHFAAFPFLLGATPSIADYALFGPLFAHLGRDPVPLAIMQKSAPRVFRWVERMHAPGLDLVDFAQPAPAFPEDALPATLPPLLAQIARELTPDLIDRLAFLRSYVAEHKPQPGEPVADKPHRRVIGQVETSFRDVAYTGGVQPYTVFLWQRLIAAGRHPAAKALFAEHDLSPLVDVDLPIRVERRDNIEVWG
ncbi:glutathione S-transferase family protein [Citromicrobium bathyomarinum]|uniref:glutathione S-transferase family protein n=1 Tax=Citromicrobium bathyomarinum TaxID=72174 RepID=UPI003159F3E0